jgi:hypothetical protein
MNKLVEAIEILATTFAREGCDGDFTLRLPKNSFFKLCWELQQHSGKYLRHHTDGSVEKGETVSLSISTPYGKVLVLSENF